MHTAFTPTGKTNDVLVIGGGAAGMMAALFAAQEGARVTLVEKNEKLGKKIYITGKGRCNVTNRCDVDTFLQNVPRNPRFLYSALRLMNPDDLLALLAAYGCETKVERGRRAFPVSDKASDVTKALEKALRQSGVRVQLNTCVKGLVKDENGICAVETDKGTWHCKAVIVCTGGVSYPSTGSTGDGYQFAEKMGLKVTERKPSLVGLLTKEAWPMQLQGLTLKNICLTGTCCGKIIYSEQGEMLFTHFGVSGPLVIELSSHLPDKGETAFFLDLKPGLSSEQLDARLQREIKAAGKKQLNSILQTLLPQRMAPVFAAVCQLDGTKVCSQVTGKERSLIAQTLKKLPLTVKGTRPIAEAIVTRGGVDVKGIAPGTMAAKNIPGLYFAGEVVDVDAHTGGYNLQIAFSTGALAGQSAARFIKDRNE
ncbi:MAG: aminoacetone oxidase family FAD-binding enzyme [Clostridia bacterium]|nr:aminoacetone oxidase family FAD-binding enzyme [Clostridia bacterium]